MPKENDPEGAQNLEGAEDLVGAQDMGGKHGGQAGQPKPPRRPDPRKAEQSSDVPGSDATRQADASESGN